MTTVNTALNNFSSGELSPKVYGRFDLAAYFNGLRRMENFISQTQGGAIFRGGFHYVAETKDGNKAFLYRFQFSDIQAYALEFTDNNIRIYKDRGIVLSGGSPVDVVSPYPEADLFELKFAQNAQDLYITHPRHNPRKLTRTSDTTWTLSLHSPTGFSPSYAVQSITNITQANPGVVTYSGADTFANGDEIFIDNVVGMTEVNGNYYTVSNVNTGANTFELDSTDTTGFTAYTSGGDLQNAFNFPSAVGIYEQRLIYGGMRSEPEKLNFSESANFDNFTVGTGATDPLSYTVAVGEDANNIEWIKGGEDFLMIGCIGDILIATGGEGESAIAPDQISIKPTNTFGVADINPVGRRQSILYPQRNQRTVLSFEKDDLGVYKPLDNNVAADHITNTGITQMAYQEGRPDVLWCTKVNGDLIGFTVDRDQQVAGWSRHTTDGNFVSVAATPRDKDFDTLWACVERTVDGATTHHIEYLNDNPEFPLRSDYVTGRENKVTDGETFQRALAEAQRSYIHLDNAATFDGSLAGLDAGATLTPASVSGNAVTFTASAAVFASGDVGKELIVKSTDGTAFGTAEIVTFNSSTSVDADILVAFNSTDAIAAGSWYLTSDTITGLDNLEGRTVSVLVDGAVHPTRTVASNTISLDTQAAVVHVGLPFTGTMETMDLEGGGTTGTSQTKKKSVYKVGVRLLNTSGLEYGTDYYRLEDRLLRQAVDLMDNPPPLFTGDEVLRFQDGGIDDQPGWGRSKRVIVQQSLPLPASVQLISPYFTVSNVD